MSSRDEDIKAFCDLRRHVAQEVFRWLEPADCLCNEDVDATYQSSERILTFIRTAVEEKIERERKAKLEAYPKNLRPHIPYVSTAQIEAFENLMSSVVDPENYTLTYDAKFGTLFVHDFAGMLIGIEDDGYTHS